MQIEEPVAHADLTGTVRIGGDEGAFGPDSAVQIFDDDADSGTSQRAHRPDHRKLADGPDVEKRRTRRLVLLLEDADRVYENDTPFEPVVVNLGREASRAAFSTSGPSASFRLIKDDARDWLVPESSIIVEYLDQHYPGRTRFIPADPDRARQVRMRDRFFDLHVQVQMQKIVGDRIRPDGQRDPYGVEQARSRSPPRSA